MLLGATAYYVCGLLWLYRGFSEGSIFKVVLACIWFSGGVILSVRYVKNKKSTKDKE